MPERLAWARGGKLGFVRLVITIVASVGSAVWITLKSRTFTWGFILRKHRKLMEARAEYESVLRINSTNFEAHGNLGLIFLEQRNLEQAEVQFQSALRINADDAIARKNLDAVLKARAAAKKPE